MQPGPVARGAGTGTPRRRSTLKCRWTRQNVQGSIPAMIERSGDLAAVQNLLRRYPAVGIVGARQVGKTTLARMVAARARGPILTFDLENPDDVAQLAEPMLALKDRRGLVVIDEIQRRPDLFPVLRVLADRPRGPARFLVLGSASPAMLRQTSETLAGRIGYHELRGLALEDVGTGQWVRLWIRGGFPRAFLARSSPASDEWRRDFIRTFLAQYRQGGLLPVWELAGNETTGASPSWPPGSAAPPIATGSCAGPRPGATCSTPRPG